MRSTGAWTAQAHGWPGRSRFVEAVVDGKLGGGFYDGRQGQRAQPSL